MSSLPKVLSFKGRGTKKRSEANTPEERLLEPSTIGKAERLGMHARHVVEGSMAGRYKSPFTGFAIEFHQHREYAPGDELKHIDWKLMGRTDRFYIKQYEQETNFDCCLLLDGSKSMQYGSYDISKMEYGRILAAVFAYLVLNERNSFALRIFDTESRSFFPKSTTPRALHNICRTLVDYQPDQQSNIGQVLHETANQLHSRGIVIVISDFFDEPEAVMDGLRHLAFNRHEVIVFHVMDPDELDFPFDGTVEFEGLEIPDKLVLQPRSVRKSYLAEVNAFLETIRKGCEQHDIHYNLVNTKQPPAEVLNRYLATRLHFTGH